MSEPSFQNLSVDPGSLPQVAAADFHKLEPRYRIIRLIGGLIFWSFVLVGLGIGSWFAPAHWWKSIAWIVAPGIALATTAYRWMAFPYMEYALRERDIIFKTGWLWKASTAIPFTRIQHAEVDQGFFERMYGLATLNIFTAGGSSSDLAIPGLTQDHANRLRDFILGRTTSVVSEETIDHVVMDNEMMEGNALETNDKDDMNNDLMTHDQ
ncbi:MAG: PH domain-containing protein [Bacteroidia bacterium]